jgi:hypothetical protein
VLQLVTEGILSDEEHNETCKAVENILQKNRPYWSPESVDYNEQGTLRNVLQKMHSKNIKIQNRWDEYMCRNYYKRIHNEGTENGEEDPWLSEALKLFTMFFCEKMLEVLVNLRKSGRRFMFEGDGPMFNQPMDIVRSSGEITRRVCTISQRDEICWLATQEDVDGGRAENIGNPLVKNMLCAFRTD